MSFNYALRQTGDVVVIELSGRLVFGEGATQTLRELVREQVMQGHKSILINLRDVRYTDTGGLGALMAVLATVANGGGTLRFCGANDSVLEVLRMTRLDTVLNATDEEPIAIANFGIRKSTVA